MMVRKIVSEYHSSRLERAKKERVRPQNLAQIAPDYFSACFSSSTSDALYYVELDANTGIGDCTCHDFRRGWKRERHASELAGIVWCKHVYGLMLNLCDIYPEILL